MLCAVKYRSTNPSAGGQQVSKYHYKAGQLSRIADPGGEVTDFGYDSAGRLAWIRDPDQADWVAANPAHANDLAYDGAQVNLPRVAH
jgi:YD repeat-containing protein